MAYGEDRLNGIDDRWVPDTSMAPTNGSEAEDGDWQLRTHGLLGSAAVARLAGAAVAVFGVGGVGGHAAEALARSGVGRLLLVDKDVVDLSNINRQLVALHSTLGRPKVEVMKERILDISPAARVEASRMFYLPETAAEFDFSRYDYIVDAVDTVSAKIQLVLAAKAAGVPIISSMGAGNKLNPADFQVADIYETSVCPLAKVMRKELKARGVEHLKVVYSKEQPQKPERDLGSGGKKGVGSVAFVPSVCGLIIASEVVKDLAFNLAP